MIGELVIWCDFGGVLTDPVAEVLERVAAQCAVPAETLLLACSAVAAEYGGDELAPLELGLLGEAEWGERVTAQLAPWLPAADLGRFSELWYGNRSFNGELYDALSGRLDVECRLAMLTNSVREWEPYRARLIPESAVFEAIVRSHEYGVRKPDPRIFRIAEQTLDVPARRCLLIDDSARNCLAAEAAGWRAIRHRGNSETLEQLDRILAAQ
ncbi:HAD-IA family hydrolase [Nocardia uniformis]|uniref:HAD-IA family hydrolase n=1 Tax=Nocardia uniformis TaxID=53432 RepID=A0A849C013_9NOCA|nr:HAD-IA family hydrolase [Nocardia uniformis]NNH68349.1 HAD-IA family hydrolase [Nocardia uniformis]